MLKDRDEVALATMEQLRILLKGIRSARLNHNVEFTYNESLIMATIRDDSTLTSTDLAAVVHSDKSTISRQLAQLEKRGYLKRERRSDNQREKDLIVTPAGRAALEASDATWARLTSARLEGWSQREMSDFLALLAKYNAHG